MNVRRALDELIDWYELHAPLAGQEIPVVASVNTVRKFARKRRGQPYRYRERVIIPIRKSRRERQQDDQQQTLIASPN